MNYEQTILLIDLDPEITTAVKSDLTESSLIYSKTTLQEIENYNSPQPALILIGPGPSHTPVELAKSLRERFKAATLFFCTLDKKNYDRKSLIENGFSDAFLFPSDQRSHIAASLFLLHLNM